MMIRLKLKETPPSTQHIYKIGKKGLYMDKEFAKLKTYYSSEFRKQYKEKAITSNLSLIIEFYFKDKRKRDLDNYLKILLDSMNGLVWKDDSQIQELTLRKFIDVKNSRTEIIIM
jgi:Holliday junction resolvase RusA-like endonuclease